MNADQEIPCGDGEELMPTLFRLSRARACCIIYLRSSAFIGGLTLLGCHGYTGPRSVANDDPAVKIPEIRRAVDTGDKSVIPQLVTDLDSNDSAIRFYSIEALRRLTGQTFGYDWTVADRHERRPALMRWHDYLQGPTTIAVESKR